MLIDNYVMDLERGYEIVRDYELGLYAEWKHRLLEAYARKWRAFEANRVAVERPEHPLHGHLRTLLLESVVSDWYKCWEGESVPEKRIGDRDENNFVSALKGLGLPATFIIHGLLQRPGDDVDVTVIGPIGIWVFEVKYWSGKIIYRDGRWRYEPLHPERKQAPDEQWSRMETDIRNTLQVSDGFLVRQVPEFRTIQGGVVFALSEAILDIHDCPVKCDKTAQWLKQLRDARPSPTMNEPPILRAIEDLLNRNYRVAPNRFRSMEAYARDIVKNAQERLERWTSE
jgi:Nuclease-related domain